MSTPKVSGSTAPKHVVPLAQRKPNEVKSDVPVGRPTASRSAEPTADVTEKLHNVDIAIAENNAAILKESNPKKRAEIEARNKALAAKKQLQQETATTSSTPDGEKVAFTVKKDITAGEFKKVFGIKDGVLAYNKELGLKPKWVDNDPRGVGEGQSSQHQDWDAAVIKQGTSFSLNPDNIVKEESENKGFFQKLFGN